MITLFIFKGAVGKRKWVVIVLIQYNIVFRGHQQCYRFRPIFICDCCLHMLGFGNNCTRMLSLKDPLQIVVIKGLAQVRGH